MISDVKFYLKLLSGRLPVMIVLFLVCAIGGVVIAQRLPTMYKTSAKLLVESAQISDDLVRSAVQVDATELLDVIQQRLLTRANMLDIARATKIFPEIQLMTPDEIVEQMREATSVRRTGGRGKATVMTITFEGRSPKKVAAVVNRYTTIVETLNSDFRTSAAEGQLEFFQQQVARHSDNLDAQSAKIVAFKTKNADALPENLQFRLTRQAQLRELLARTERDLANLDAQRESIKRVYEATGTLAATNSAQSPAEKELQALESEMRIARSVYSEQNPKVRNLRNRIEAVRAIVQANVLSTPSGDGDDDDSTPTTALDVGLAELDSRSTAMRQEAVNAKKELEELEGAFARAPINDITLAALERDLQNTQNLYTEAVKQLSRARMREQVELESKGEQIRVLESANVPTTPSSPNRPRVIALGVGIGLGLAAAFFMLLELLNLSIRRPVDVVKGISITPLATIPRIETAAHRRWRRVAQIASMIVILVGVPTLLWMIDTFYMPLDLLFEKLKDKLV